MEHVTERSYSFPKSHRLRSRLEFSAVFQAKVSDARGPLIMYALPNHLSHPRLGLVVGRRLGSAVKRNRIKRLLRETFRLHQYDLPQGYDFIIVVRPHAELILAEYQKLLTTLMLRLHHTWEKRSAKC